MCDRDGDSVNSSVAGRRKGVNNTNIIKNNEGSALEAFRGFAKAPVVLVERLDTKPYLKRKAQKTSDTEIDISYMKTKFDRRFFEKCSVNVIRDDLDKLLKLKKTYSKASSPVYTDTDMDDTQANIKCKICDKAYLSEKKLLNHQENKHMIVYKPEQPKSKKRVSFSDIVIVHEVKEYHKCRKCTKIFENYRSLKGHMKEQHKKRKCYTCNYCAKKFVDRMFFKVHIKLHCDMCGLLSQNRTAFLEHKRLVCKTMKLYKCKTCDDTFFKFMDLKDHSYEHVGTCFVCDICKDQCPTKCAVAHHICYLHSKKCTRSPPLYLTRKLGTESLFLCKFCDESSVDKDLIEKHVEVLPDLNNRVMTGYKDYYFCDQCMKKFDTEKDMLQHKWSHFLKTPDNSQIRPKGILTNKNREVKIFYNINEKIPDGFQPKVVIEKLKIAEKILAEKVTVVDINSTDNLQGGNKVVNSEGGKKMANSEGGNKEDNSEGGNKMGNSEGGNKVDNLEGGNKVDNSEGGNIVCNSENGNNIDNAKESNSLNTTNGNTNAEISKGELKQKKSRKVLFSKHQCQTCGKYFSSNFCLNRHVATLHRDYENLRCKVCEEIFVWPSLLERHKCIRLQIPEMPFEDARPEIHFTNYNSVVQGKPTAPDFENQTSNGFDDFNIPLVDDDDYLNAVDFEIPAPIVELTELENGFAANQVLNQSVSEKVIPLQNLGYKVVVQEVPIEF